MEIELQAVAVKLQAKTIVEDINLQLKNKAMIGLVGPNGSGKSTILRTIYRSLSPAQGKIYFDQVDFAQIPLQQTAQKLGVMKQMNQLPFDFKVLDLVLFGRTPFKKPLELDNDKDYALAQHALEVVGMLEYADRSYNSLSGGEQQRVMIARVLAGEPQALLLDELTNHLDIYYQFHLLKLLKDLHVETIAVMHDLNLAARYCDYLYFLKKGKLVAHGPTAEVLTPELIAEVFQMKASVQQDQQGLLQIHFEDTL